MNGCATPSPVIEPCRAYIHFGSVGTACLDTSTGKVLWKRDDLRCRHYRGPASSLVLFEKTRPVRGPGLQARSDSAVSCRNPPPLFVALDAPELPSGLWPHTQIEFNRPLGSQIAQCNSD